MDKIDKLKTALVAHLATLGVTLVPKRSSAWMWVVHVLMYPFMKVAGRSYIDDYTTVGLKTIWVPVPKEQPQTYEQAVRVVDVTTLAHELTHIYQGRRRPVTHYLGYICPQLPILGAALLLVPLHAWLATISGWAHLMFILYAVAIAFSCTPLVKLVPWRPRFDTEHDAYITSAFVLHRIAGYVEHDHVVNQFVRELSGPTYLWTAPESVARAAGEAAHAAVTRGDPLLLTEPSRKLVSETI